MEPPKKSASPHISSTLLKEFHLSPFSNAPRGGDHDSDWCGAEWPGFIVRHSTHFGRESDRMSILRTPECTQDVPIPNGITASQRYFFTVWSPAPQNPLHCHFTSMCDAPTALIFLQTSPRYHFCPDFRKSCQENRKYFYFIFWAFLAILNICAVKFFSFFNQNRTVKIYCWI